MAESDFVKEVSDAVLPDISSQENSSDKADFSDQSIPVTEAF